MTRTSPRTGRISGRRTSALTLAVVALLSALLAVPSAASASTAGNSAPLASAPTSTEQAQPLALAAKRLNITMQAQQKSNWCWAGSGNTIATWYGRNYSQNQFCNAAFGRSQSTECPNSQATLGNVQSGLRWAGINSGSYVTGWLQYSTVQTEINADRPIETRIQWSSGGGHMHVIYGYDTAQSWVYWGDPWPSSTRYNWASHNWYVNNNEFSWTHSLYRIGA
ncbi:MULTISPECIES: papain-like cysteine protease family protein [unclassified Embleya]|uniref:papain-like cysteine protease family protein n=1 Tax=unclassified Embleya TaxID=2699296 RepID=UPI0033F97BBE